MRKKKKIKIKIKINYTLYIPYHSMQIINACLDKDSIFNG